MAKQVDQNVAIVDNFNTDAFGRLRTSSPIAQFEYQNEYNKGPLIWVEKITGGATSTHLPNESSVLMSTGGEVVASGYALTGTGAARGQAKSNTQSKYPLALDIDGATPPIMALVCTSFTGTATVNASLGFKEYY